MFHIVKRVIDRWNPYSLLPDAPDDEFDRESRSIAEKINENSSIDEIAFVVSSVFSKSFEQKYFCLEDCIEVAKDIKSNLEN